LRARITVAFVGLLAVALLLAGAASLLLVRHAQSENAQRAVLSEAEAFVGAVNNPKIGPLITKDQAVLDAVLEIQREVLGLRTYAVLTVSPGAKTVGGATADVPASRIDAAALAAGRSTSGSYNHVAFAAVPLFAVGSGRVALMFESEESFSSSSVDYFLLAGGISLLVAAGLSSVISRRVSTSVVAVAAAADAIAKGDLGIRIEPGRRAYPEIAQLDRAISAMAEDLAQGERAEREFLLSISHDLRTPLTSIRGYSEAIADGAAADPRRAAEIVISESGRLERLIGDLLDLARLHARQFSLDAVPTDAAAAVQSAAEGLRYEFEAVGVNLTVEVPAEAVTAVLDVHRVGQIVANLAENALKFAASAVTVRLVAEARRLTISVVDDGPGIAPEDLPHVLERRYSSARFAARSAGSGIGLAIVSELTAAMSGEIAVLSPTGEAGGTAITISLPRDGAGSDRAARP